MQTLVGYWLIGCIIMGAAVGQGQKNCPNDPPVIDLRTTEALVLIAVWPAVSVAATIDRRETTTGCKVP